VNRLGCQCSPHNPNACFTNSIICLGFECLFFSLSF
jgi:hypothetical protein